MLAMLAYAAFRAAPHEKRIAIIHEDGVVEYAGAGAFLVTAALMFLVFRHLRRHPTPAASPLKPFVALGMAALFFFAAGEEISWGQRIFGIATPEALLEANHQQETNFHNLGVSQFDEYRLFTLAWFPYVLLLPALAAIWAPARAFTSRLVPIVSPAAWPFGLLYLLNDAIAWVVGKSLTINGQYDNEIDFPRVELRESTFALLTALTAYLVLRAAKSHRNASDGTAWQQRERDALTHAGA